MSDLAGLPMESKPAPKALRVLAMAENLGVLRSVHEPTSWFTRIQFRQGRIYLFDAGFVLGQANGSLKLFRWGQFTVRKTTAGLLITGSDGRAMGLGKKWSGRAELAQAITAGAKQDQ